MLRFVPAPFIIMQPESDEAQCNEVLVVSLIQMKAVIIFIYIGISFNRITKCT